MRGERRTGGSLCNGFAVPIVFTVCTRVPRLAKAKWQILVSYHVLNLSLHCDAEEGYEVHDQYRPKHRDIENLEEGSEDGDEGRLGHAVPELELRQPPHKRSKLLVGFGREARTVIFVTEVGGIDLWREEGKEQVEVVDAQRVADNIPALQQEDPKQEHADHNQARRPSGDGVWSPLVQVVLV